MDGKGAPVEVTYNGLRVSTQTCDRLRVFGEFGESWNDLLTRLVGELEECRATHISCLPEADEPKAARPAPVGKE